MISRTPLTLGSSVLALLALSMVFSHLLYASKALDKLYPSGLDFINMSFPNSPITVMHSAGALLHINTGCTQI